MRGSCGSDSWSTAFGFLTPATWLTQRAADWAACCPCQHTAGGIGLVVTDQFNLYSAGFLTSYQRYTVGTRRAPPSSVCSCYSHVSVQGPHQHRPAAAAALLLRDGTPLQQLPGCHRLRPSSRAAHACIALQRKTLNPIFPFPGLITSACRPDTALVPHMSAAARDMIAHDHCWPGPDGSVLPSTDPYSSQRQRGCNTWAGCWRRCACSTAARDVRCISMS